MTKIVNLRDPTC